MLIVIGESGSSHLLAPKKENVLTGRLEPAGCGVQRTVMVPSVLQYPKMEVCTEYGLRLYGIPPGIFRQVHVGIRLMFTVWFEGISIRHVAQIAYILRVVIRTSQLNEKNSPSEGHGNLHDYHQNFEMVQ